MAIYLRQTTTKKDLNPAYQDFYLFANGSEAIVTAGVGTNLKYVLYVYDLNGTLLATLKVAANADGRAIFRVDNIIQDFTKTDVIGYDTFSQVDSKFKDVGGFDKRHSIHHIDSYSRNKDNVKVFYFRASAEYVSTIDGSLVSLPISNAQPYLRNFYYFWNGVAQHKDGEEFNTTQFLLDGNTKKALTSLDSTVNRKIRIGDYHTIAFFTGTYFTDNTTETSSVFDQVKIKTYNDSDVLQTTYIYSNVNANGGGTATSISENQNLLYLGCGTQNIDNEYTEDFDGVSYYTVQAFNGASVVSVLYRFDIVGNDCKGYETIRLAFVNRLGTYDYYNFDKKSIKTTSIVRSTFKQDYGHTPSTKNGSNYHDYGSYEGGTKNYNVNATETIEANTDYISETEAVLLEELFTSPDVYMQNADGNFEPVVITNSEYIKQTTANNMVKQYFITLQKGHNTRVQRL